MKTQKTKYLKDYTTFPFHVETVDLHVELDPEKTQVISLLNIRRNASVKPADAGIDLNGEHLQLLSVKLDGREISHDAYTYDGAILHIETVPDAFTLEIKTCIAPEKNTALEGLYRSSGNYCTQCEAEGFRRITCYPDRPDVMAVFTTTIVADPDTCPVMLSNGNLLHEETLADGRRSATWHDPFPKPCYLFALVAGNLVCVEGSFITMSGRSIALKIFVEERNRGKCGHAMQSLKKAMLWDEQRFGREYDLDTYMIVAVDDFNMGAMENKGLNVFNSKYVLAEPATATDTDYQGIEGVIAHEYFHNWTGNRITCRDWFQLSLKEGLTVFRDQEFSADMGSRAVKRINDVNVIRSFQFREDSGPMAHPVRPESFVEINNFYTLTVYNKGAEVIRMISTLLGREGFRKGMDLYFERHDGQAVTCDDFVTAMEDACKRDLSQFKLWYSQAGTPEVEAGYTYDRDKQAFTVSLKQSCPATPGQENKKPFYFPVNLGLLDKNGKELVNAQLICQDSAQDFTFPNIAEQPIVSLLRDFSAPVRLHSNLLDNDLAFLMSHDSDPFNRWDAGQQLGLNSLLQEIVSFQKKQEIVVPNFFKNAFGQLLSDTTTDPALIAAAAILPSETWIGQQMAVIDPEAVSFVRQHFRFQLAQAHRERIFLLYQELTSEEPYCYSSEQASRRALRNCCLSYLLCAKPDFEPPENQFLQLGREQYQQSDNMTDVFAALTGVVNANRVAGDELLADFYQQWQHDPLVVDKWLMLQATCILPGTLARVKELKKHPGFSMKNPNKVRSLIGAFCSNLHQFHAADGAGYSFLADCIKELDPKNPQIAARLLTPLTQWKRYDVNRQGLMKNELQRIAEFAGLSGDVAEIVHKSLH